MALTVDRVPFLDDVSAADVRALVRAVEQRDGAPPLSDQALTQLADSNVLHAIARDGDAVAGYAQLGGQSLEVVGDAASAGALLDDLAADRDVLVWSHGSHSPLPAALEARGFVRRRTLHQLRLPMQARPGTQPLPDGIVVRPFEVGRDEQEWLRVNAAAFATHPEQGGWQLADLQAREAEDWFDAAGFLLAERDGRLLAYHWTKVHPDGSGEVYVLGVDPAAQGLRLGGALLGRGLAHLFDRGCRTVLLYVDDDNTTAMHLYERSGFRPFDVDVQWSR